MKNLDYDYDTLLKMYMELYNSESSNLCKEIDKHRKEKKETEYKLSQHPEQSELYNRLLNELDDYEKELIEKTKVLDHIYNVLDRNYNNRYDFS